MCIPRVALSMFLFIVAGYLLGCKNQVNGRDLDDVKSSIRQLSNQIAPIASSVSDTASSGASHIFRLEYRVIDLPGSTSAAAMETTLNQLGVDRWDCFSVIPVGDLVRISCKKVPYSAVKSLAGF